MTGETGPKKQLGKIMLQQKLVTPEQLKQLVVEQQRAPGGRLASMATRGGQISVPQALAALAEQQGVPPADVTQMIIDLSLLNLMPRELAVEHRALPFEMVGDKLSIAMASPDDADALEELGFLTGKTILPHVALDDALMAAIDGAYDALARRESHYDGKAIKSPAAPQRSAAEVPAAEPPAPALPPPPADMLPAAQPLAPQPEAEPVPRRAEPPPPPEAEPPAGAVEVAPPVANPEPDEAVADEPEYASAPPLPEPAQSDSIGPELDAAFAERMAPSVAPSKSEYEDATVLLANVESELRSALATALEQNGITVANVDSGRAVLEHLETNTPNMLLLDTELVEMSGFDVCRRLRNSPKHEHLPVIMTSARHRGWRFEADLRECFRIRHYFEHPIDIDELTRTIRLELEGEQVLPKPIDLEPETQGHLDASMEAFERGQLDNAIAHLEAGASLTPDSFQLQYHLGLLYGHRGDLFLAISALEHAVERQPRHFSALKNLAVVYQRVGFRYRAIETWQWAMWRAPDEETRVGIRTHMIALL